MLLPLRAEHLKHFFPIPRPKIVCKVETLLYLGRGLVFSVIESFQKTGISKILREVNRVLTVPGGSPQDNVRRVGISNINMYIPRVNVQAGSEKPHKCGEGFYIREGANSQKMSRNEIQKMILSQGKSLFEGLIAKNFGPKDFGELAFKGHMERAGISRRANRSIDLFNLAAADHEGK